MEEIHSVEDIYEMLRKKNITVAKNVIYRNVKEINKYLKKGSE